MKVIDLTRGKPARWAVLTPVSTYIISGDGHTVPNNGPLQVFDRSSMSEPPRSIATISQPWALVDIDTYEAMRPEHVDSA